MNHHGAVNSQGSIDEMEALELAALRIAIDEQPSDDPMIAAEALTRGFDSPSLRDAAGTPRSEVRDARDRFVAALDELQIPIPSAQQAL